jgi:DHA2 family multidrug resistance protein-like MFS transporter
MGFGFFQSPNLKALMTSAPPHRSGGASGIVATARLLGQSVGALVALCFNLSETHGSRWRWDSVRPLPAWLAWPASCVC